MYNNKLSPTKSITPQLVKTYLTLINRKYQHTVDNLVNYIGRKVVVVAGEASSSARVLSCWARVYFICARCVS